MGVSYVTLGHLRGANAYDFHLTQRLQLHLPFPLQIIVMTMSMAVDSGGGMMA